MLQGYLAGMLHTQSFKKSFQPSKEFLNLDELCLDQQSERRKQLLLRLLLLLLQLLLPRRRRRVLLLLQLLLLPLGAAAAATTSTRTTATTTARMLPRKGCLCTQHAVILLQIPQKPGELCPAGLCYRRLGEGPGAEKNRGVQLMAETQRGSCLGRLRTLLVKIFHDLGFMVIQRPYSE